MKPDKLMGSYLLHPNWFDMCGRATLTKNESDLEERFDATFYTETILRYNPIPSYNVAPTHVLPYIGSDNPGQFYPGKWGWHMSGNEKGHLLINARIDEISEKKTFVPHLDHGRCLIPLDGYIEWMKNDKSRIPFFLHLQGRELFSVAGLFREETDMSGKNFRYLLLITRPPEEKIGFIHDRMPLILTPGEEKMWLEGDFDPAWIEYFCQPDRNLGILYHRVSPRINSVQNNDPELLKKTEADISIQQTLF